MRDSKGVETQLADSAFRLLWSVYAFLHFPLTAHLWTPWPWIRHLAVAAWLLACWALSRPSAPRRFTALVVAWTAADVVSLPFVPNHVLFTLFVNATYLLAMGEAALRERRSAERGPSAMPGFASFATLARLELLILYGWATIHKLNRGYLDPAISCGWQFYREIADRLPLLPTHAVLSQPVIAASLLVEAALPLLLVLRRTRSAAIASGLAFHLLLSFHPGWLLESFGCAVLALLSLFVPPATLRAAAQLLEAPALSGLRRAAGLWRGVLVIAAAAALWIAMGRGEAAIDGLAQAARAAWFAGAPLALVFFVAASRRARAAHGETVPVARSLLAPQRWGLAAVLPVVVMFNGASPYLGLKTETSFSMFSNLRTEAGEENHLFLPRLDWFDFQDEVIEIGAANAPDLARLAATGERLVWFELRRALYRRHDEGLKVRYRVDGAWREATSAAPIPLLLDRALVFRPLPPAGAPATCRH